MTVLVAASSRYGATSEIAEAIGRTLARRGVPVDVRDVGQVSDLSGYQAAVLGSAVYMGQWRQDARHFVEAHRDELAAMPTWLFSSGPPGDPLRPGAADAVRVDELMAATGAREHRLFAGRIERGRLTAAHRAIARVVRASDGDFRDWSEIEAWAYAIASTLSD